MSDGTDSTPTCQEGLHITQEEGFLCHIQVHTKLDIEPQKAFEIIADPDNARMFRSIDECSHRKVLHDNGRGRQRVDVEHSSSWRFMMWGGKFVTRLLVEQDDKDRVMAFQLNGSGFMRNFEGFWRMEPFPGNPKATMAVLHQNILPKVSAPGLNWVLTGICKRQIENMVEDVQKEVERLNKGEPIPKHQLAKLKRSWKEPAVKGFSLDLDGSDDEADSPTAGSSAAEQPAEQSQPSLPKTAVTATDNWPLLQAAKHNMISAAPSEQAADAAEKEDAGLPAAGAS